MNPGIRLLSGATAGTSAPSAATDGYALRKPTPGTSYYWDGRNVGLVSVYSTAGSGTMTVTIRLWGYKAASGKWFPLGSSSTESNRGVLNTESAIDEDGADSLVHAELVQGLAAFDRIAAQVTNIGGTSTAVNVDLEPAAA